MGRKGDIRYVVNSCCRFITKFMDVIAKLSQFLNPEVDSSDLFTEPHTLINMKKTLVL